MADKNKTWRRPWTMIGGGGGASSWNDLTDRPLYETPEEILESGSPDGDNVITFSLDAIGYSGAILFKVSNNLYTKDELIGKFLRGNDGSELEIFADGFHEFPGAFLHEYGIAIIYSASELSAAFEVKEGYIQNGTYFMWNTADAFMVYQLYIPSALKVLDDKFLPETVLKLQSINNSSNILSCKIDDGWTMCAPDWVRGNWNTVFGNLQNVAVKVVYVYISVENAAGKCMSKELCFVMNRGDDCFFGSCFVHKYGFGDAQIFLRVHEIGKTVYVAAKTIDI